MIQSCSHCVIPATRRLICTLVFQPDMQSALVGYRVMMGAVAVSAPAPAWGCLYNGLCALCDCETCLTMQ